MAQYTIPEWLRPPPDPGNQFLQGYSTGGQLAEAQARLQAQATESQRAHDMEMQKLEISRAYNQQQLGLQQQELGMKQQQAQMQLAETQRKFAAQQKYQQLVAGGMNAGEALMQVGPDLGLTNLVGAAQMMKALRKPQAPQIFTSPHGQEYMHDPETGVDRWGARPTIPHSIQELYDKEGRPYFLDPATGKITFPPQGKTVKPGQWVPVIKSRADALRREIEGLRKQQNPTQEDMMEAQAQTPAGGDVTKTLYQLKQMKIDAGEKEYQKLEEENARIQAQQGAGQATIPAGVSGGAAPAGPSGAVAPAAPAAPAVPAGVAPTAPAGVAPGGRRIVVKRDAQGGLIGEVIPWEESGGGGEAAAAAPAPGIAPSTLPPVDMSTQPGGRATLPPAKPPAPKVSLDDFWKYMHQSGNALKVIGSLADEVAVETGYAKSPATQVGGSTLHWYVGGEFEDALMKGKSSKMPGITRESILNYIQQLPEAQRTALLTRALNKSGVFIPEPPKPKVVEARVPEPITGYE